MSIFIKSARISDPIADFFEVGHGTQMTLSKILAGIEDYITEHNLMDDERRGLYPDEKIETLVKYVLGDEYDCGWISLFELHSSLARPFYRDERMYEWEEEYVEEYSYDGEECSLTAYYRNVASGLITKVLPEFRTEFRNEVRNEVRNEIEDRRRGLDSVFCRSQLISDEMADFLGVDYGTAMRRTDVSREIYRYVERYNLKDDNNSRNYFNADSTLAKLLNYYPNDNNTRFGKLGYYNIQKYIKHHFLPRNAVKPYVYNINTKKECLEFYADHLIM